MKKSVSLLLTCLALAACQREPTDATLASAGSNATVRLSERGSNALFTLMQDVGIQDDKAGANPPVLGGDDYSVDSVVCTHNFNFAPEYSCTLSKETPDGSLTYATEDFAHVQPLRRARIVGASIILFEELAPFGELSDNDTARSAFDVHCSRLAVPHAKAVCSLSYR